MTIDSTLKIKRGGGKLRNVLKRHERIAKMQEDGRWKDDSTVLGMPKVRVLKLSLKKKKKAKTEGDAAAPAAKGAAAPAAGKAAAAKPAGKK